ncbi:MAG: 50S ribosomal protein L10 [Bacteroidetes bacterium]|nr:MAG: 50S ribosomal protein L10 [Bacteroidota bacterium]
MNKKEKNEMIDSLSTMLKENAHFYLTDPSGLTVEKTSQLRRMCFDKGVKMLVVKNTLLSKAMEKTSNTYDPFHDTLKGTTAIMFSAVANAPGKIMKEFRKGSDKLTLKSAWVEESVYIGHNQLDTLAGIKSKNEMIGEIIGLLQSPTKTVIGALLAERKGKGGKATPAAPDAPAAPEAPTTPAN